MNYVIKKILIYILSKYFTRAQTLDFILGIKFVSLSRALNVNFM